MIIIAFDQATLNSGFSVYKDGEYMESGVIKKSHNIHIDTRIQDMAKSICQKIKEADPDIVILENIQDQNSTSTIISLARLQGAIMFYCANKGIRVELLGPTSWRSLLGFKQGKGVKRDALKQQSVDYVKENLGLDIASIDECEAVAIGAAACKLYDYNTK